MYHQTRGGTRGGAAEFNWNDVKKDEKYRENYLGSSVKASVGRWQQNKDINWYSKKPAEKQSKSAAAAKAKEIAQLKQEEAEHLAAYLGARFSTTIPRKADSKIIKKPNRKN